MKLTSSRVIRAFNIGLVSMIFVAWIVPVHAQTKSNPEAYVLGTEVNLRTGPGLTYPSLGAIWIGARGAVLERQNGWARMRLTVLGQELVGWMRDDVLSDRPLSRHFFEQKLAALQGQDLDARQLWTMRGIAFAIANRESVYDAQYEELAKILEAKGQKQAAERARKQQVDLFNSSTPPLFDRKGLSQRKDHVILSMPKVVLRQVPTLGAVPVRFNGEALELSEEEAILVREAISDFDGKEWALISTFRMYGDTTAIAGWVPAEIARNAKRFVRLTQWTGPNVVSASGGDWADTYYIDADGSVYDQSGKGQLWRLEEGDSLLGEMPTSIQYFSLKNGEVCTYGGCATTIARLQSGKAVENEADALTVAKSLMDPLKKAVPSVRPLTKRADLRKPADGIYVFTVDTGSQLHSRTPTYAHIVVLKSGEAGAFRTIDKNPE